MKSKSKNNNNTISTFLAAVDNLANFSPSLSPLLPVDTTAFNTLNEIFDETQGDNTKEGQFLHQVSSRLLNTFNKIYQHHAEVEKYQGSMTKRNNLKQSRRQNKNSLNQPKGKKQTTYGKFLKQQPNKLIIKCENDQNIDLSNFQQVKNNPKSEVYPINLQLKEIIRPEYRKKNIQKKDLTFQQELAQPIKKRVHTTYNYQDKQRQAEFQMIPILTLRKKKQDANKKVTPPRQKRSISPKIEGKRHSNKIQLTNISAISKKVQTESSQSLDLDINCLNTYPEATDPFSTSKQDLGSQYQSIKSVSSHNSQQEDKISNNFYYQRQRANSQEIQEEQPWECDQEEIEEELRQIDQRLSHRGYKHQKVQTHLQQHNLSNIRDQSKSPQTVEHKNKEPKKVRLSLTPTKNKTSPYRKKVERVTKKTDQIVSTENHHSQEIRYQKWKKPQKGHIIVDIQSYLIRE